MCLMQQQLLLEENCSHQLQLLSRAVARQGSSPHRQQVACPMVSVVFDQVPLGECTALRLCSHFFGPEAGGPMFGTVRTAGSSLTGPLRSEISG